MFYNLLQGYSITFLMFGKEYNSLVHKYGESIPNLCWSVP